MATSTPTGPLMMTARKKWMFRAASVSFAVGLFFLLEMVCAWLDLGQAPLENDPFVGFATTEPLFGLNDAGDRFEIRPSRQRFFAADSFLARKPVEGRRVFCLGGSTVQGRPYSRETSFTTWLELALQTVSPDRTWEVVNCGGVSYASYRLVPILKECLDHAPDLIILCMGHNEFLEDRSYPTLNKTPRWLLWPLRQLTHLRLYRLMEQGWLHGWPRPRNRAEKRPFVLPTEVDAWLDHRDGIKVYHWDEKWRDGVMAHFGHNLERMIQLCSDAEVPLILVKPPSNLKDCPPFKGESNKALSEEQSVRRHQLIKQARADYGENPSRSKQRLQEALELDPTDAMTWFALGKCQESLGDFPAARFSFLQARERDVCPLRMLGEMEKTLLQTARRFGTPVVDAHALLEERSTLPILGNEMLVDHVHPSIRGHQIIAKTLLPIVASQFGVELESNWASPVQPVFQRHLDSLDALYFSHGQRNLDNLRAWTEGRADGLPLEQLKENDD